MTAAPRKYRDELRERPAHTVRGIATARGSGVEGACRRVGDQPGTDPDPLRRRDAG